jgi:hypothetical protein
LNFKNWTEIIKNKKKSNEIISIDKAYNEIIYKQYNLDLIDVSNFENKALWSWNVDKEN